MKKHESLIKLITKCNIVYFNGKTVKDRNFNEDYPDFNLHNCKEENITIDFYDENGGDLLLYVMLTEDDSKEDKTYHCVTLNFNDLGEKYKFTGKYYDENNENSEFYFPIVEGKFIQPNITSLKEFNDYMRHFPTKK